MQSHGRNANMATFELQKVIIILLFFLLKRETPVFLCKKGIM